MRRNFPALAARNVRDMKRLFPAAQKLRLPWSTLRMVGAWSSGSSMTGTPRNSAVPRAGGVLELGKVLPTAQVFDHHEARALRMALEQLREQADAVGAVVEYVPKHHADTFVSREAQ
jgi:hypothetical protein